MPLPPIIYEDDALIAFDKPSGLLIAPDRWDKTRENLMGLIHDKFGHTVANVHRLDADTSGIVLCTKTKPALDFVSGQFQSKTVRKKYLALTVLLPPERAMKFPSPIVPRTAGGILPETFTVETGLDHDNSNPGRMRVFRKRGGKPSLTEFTALERFGRYVLYECRPVTGRTHQIRVHLAAVGAPCLNDPFYGDTTEMLLLSNLKRGYKGRADEKPLIARLALHASELTITHPLTREPVTIHCETPNDFNVALKYLRKFPGREKR
ncbi:23S rRNA-/tRNA-specific pseudouridylate synthase [Ereboglobus sp. PH5-5]|uniref:RluA family pseudouridine synthase n=1 Tax=unclassified Ereboglobus TaxID=2626932 RepID=UPI00240758F0|nr:MULTISPECIES: RluA family pseudouridine synthase [unclassified Ereboglobus]MDF9828202.1 23S rRNA-/tRNA-specific pseudouridylate synthase [Ereboglobus sp. PH5-10]MDF9832431.1 23S rRNA-/tRNA-specific pseudouridylate synthase [Ereboglobus sp. PH5-5]